MTMPPPTDAEIKALLSGKIDEAIAAELAAKDQPTCRGMNSVITAIRREQADAALAPYLEKRLAERWGIDPALAAEFASRPATLELQAKQARLLELLANATVGQASPQKK